MTGWLIAGLVIGLLCIPFWVEADKNPETWGRSHPLGHLWHLSHRYVRRRTDLRVRVAHVA